MKNYIKTPTLLLLVCWCCLSCKKQNEWLDVKTTKASVVPTTIKDFQALLDEGFAMNDGYSTAGLIGADNFYLTDNNYNASNQETRNLYIWNKSVWEGESSIHWNNYFKIVVIANAVLDGLNKVDPGVAQFDNVKGQALFHRAMAYYSLSQLFCKSYSGSAGTDLGLPLRATSDVNVIAQRSSLKETYEMILNDALSATTHLQDAQTYLHRPVRAASYALLAKTCLVMGDYQKALEYSTKSLELNSQIIDFNNINLVDINQPYRFPNLGRGNPEILFYSESNQYEAISPYEFNTGIVSDELYSLYNPNDLRKSVFFAEQNGEIKYRGTYTGSFGNFTGLATNEIYFIRAECYARLNNISAAIQDLNSILRRRYITGNFTERSAGSASVALSMILTERRKEFPFTGNIRWEDLKRLNLENEFKKTLTRTVNNVVYTLLPNDKRYVLPIPRDEVQLSGLIQNER